VHRLAEPANQFVIPEIASLELIYSCGADVYVHVNPVRETAWISSPFKSPSKTATRRAQVDQYLITIETEDGGKMQIFRNTINLRSPYSFIISSADKQPTSWGHCALMK
jgi:hypothetical protein